jgi:hypothetical protein
MRRLGTTVGGTLLWLWVLAAGALAQYPPTEQPPASPAGHGTNGVAFTGTSISLGVVILVVLLTAATVLFLLGRRRRIGAVA